MSGKFEKLRTRAADLYRKVRRGRQRTIDTQSTSTLPEGVPLLPERELRSIDLTLLGQPTLDHLAVFIQDPQQTDQYWFRKLQLKVGSLHDPTSGNKISYVDVIQLPMVELAAIPCPKSLVNHAAREIQQHESTLVADNQETRHLQAVVGIANYTGDDTNKTVDELVALVGHKYASLYLATLN
jgi:hypothetical protein